MTIRIAAFAGSLRKGSFNRKVLSRAILGAEEAGAEVDLIDLNDFHAPLYDGDIESDSGLPDQIRAFKERIEAAQGLLIASPEYNSSVSAALKNAIDWASRPSSKQDPRPCFKNKVCALLTTSPGHLGGIRGLSHLREILHNVGVKVINEQYALPGASTAFAQDGALTDTKLDERVQQIGQALVASTRLYWPEN
jgi:NAD(P)H-dependent FMN reductase